MGVRTWTYLIGDDEVPRRLTQKVVADLRERGGFLREHASRRRKIIVVQLEASGQAPPILIYAIGRYWIFDEKGSLRAQLWQEQVDVANLMPGSYVPISGRQFDENSERLRLKAAREEIAERTAWIPTDDDMEPVIRDIWRMPLDKWRTLNLEMPARNQ